MEPSTPVTHLARTRHSREESRERIIAAAADLVRTNSYAELSVGDVMAKAGFGRTIFYRHFDDLADLLMRAGREAVDELFEAQATLALARADAGDEAIRQAMEAAVSVYRRHGPVLRAVAEAAAVDERVAAGYAEQRRRFDAMVEEAMREAGMDEESTEMVETARALNLMNESYLLDAFGRNPRVSAETAVDTLTAIWVGSFAP